MTPLFASLTISGESGNLDIPRTLISKLLWDNNPIRLDGLYDDLVNGFS